MKLANCKKCKKLFRSGRFDICEECIEKEKRTIDSIRCYVELNEGNEITVEMISENTNTDINEIYYLFKKGKLICLNENVLLKCKICGKRIKGRTIFCPNCSSEIKDVIEKMKESTKDSSENLPQSNINLSSKKSSPSSRSSKSQRNNKFGFKKDY